LQSLRLRHPHKDVEMRAFIVAGMTAASVLVASTGCSTFKMPSLPKFGKAKSKATDASGLANAPPAPPLNSAAGTAAPVAQPVANSSVSYPVYPGTSYPHTPHPDPSFANVGTAPAAYTAAAPSYGAVPAYGAMPPSAPAATAPNPYAAYPAAAALAPPVAPPAYAPPASYAQPQQTPYSAAPYGQQPAPAYTQQTAPPYSPPANPYAPPAAQNAANPYGNVTR
jgi:hypothetical protein